jgi:protein involved in polysaccharide export with SLBB domain
LKYAFTVGMTLLFLSQAPRALAQSAALDSASASLAPGDILRIHVWNRPEFSGDFVVAPDSTITHPLLRSIRVAGVPSSVVETRVRDFLLSYDANPTFVISVMLRVFVGGEVRTPNVYTVPPGSNITQLISLAGGPTERGQLAKVLLVRRQQRYVFDLTISPSPGATSPIQSGDQIFVSRRRSIFADILVPAASLIGAAAGLVNIFLVLKK